MAIVWHDVQIQPPRLPKFDAPQLSTRRRHLVSTLRRTAAHLAREALSRWNCPAFSLPLPVRWVPSATQVDLDDIYAEVPDLDTDGFLGVSFRNVMPEQDVNAALRIGVAQSVRTG